MSRDPMQIALHKLGARAYSIFELKKLLVSQGFGSDEIEICLEKLVEWGYLNDTLLSQQLYQYYTGRKHYGRLLLAKRLAARGIPAQNIQEILHDYEPGEKRVARQAAEKFVQARQNKDCRKLQLALVRHLRSRGFTEAVILDALNESGLGPEDDTAGMVQLDRLKKYD